MQSIQRYAMRGNPMTSTQTTLANYLKPKEVCEILSINPSTLYRWTKSGKFPKPIVIGSTPRYSAETIQAFIQSREKQAQESN